MCFLSYFFFIFSYSKALFLFFFLVVAPRSLYVNNRVKCKYDAIKVNIKKNYLSLESLSITIHDIVYSVRDEYTRAYSMFMSFNVIVVVGCLLPLVLKKNGKNNSFKFLYLYT